MDKDHIIREIRRTASANGGAALGRGRFENETGIRRHDWYGKYWTCWGDAVREAGLEPNQMSEAYDDETLLKWLASLTRRLCRVPTEGDLRLERRNDADFPSHSTFQRLGSKAQRVARMLAFCQATSGYDDVAAIWGQASTSVTATEVTGSEDTPPTVGYVYLLKHGTRREYKIGRTNNPLRREGELGIQLPEKCQPVHYIQTDDPEGVEAYWHRRFAGKRKEGEWFALTPQDVRAFKRWRRIY
jgi:hypothetical protein